MMIEPSISDLMKKFDSRYTLAMATAKRARQLTDGDTPLSNKGSKSKPVSVAVNELYEDKVAFKRERAISQEKYENNFMEDGVEICAKAGLDMEFLDDILIEE